ncbi:SH3 domain-containing protein [Leptospira wolffii]|uniref:SH3 domain-containing protein n=1 Tax=Leptospira wolffii TaxID=409998 RepID=UPI001082A5C2|nr:SH3 domain-containing protein [Leptospira wolffii]TGK61869.1 SH3 domain-containing protein [Leptospira wolffii]TGK67505.1 SH3 domain-containing protein [Leptospira wolffii]TGK74747.1 SH3 domain-containing protein [Leptospira wolffii]TGL31677.1 SH3 domain-containing protein [Leptospira wolffii]
MRKFSFKVFTIFSIVYGVYACASTPIGFGYVSQKDVKVYAKPSLKSEVLFSLDRSKKYEILTVDVPDKDSALKLLWLKIRQDEKTGYVSREEESIKNTLSTFFPVLTNKFGLVTATQLMLRETPGVNGKVLGKLQTREIVELQEEQSKSVSIDGMTGTWAKIKTKSGQNGFVFTAYVMRDSTPEILAKTKDINLPQTGWAYLKKEPKKIYTYSNGKLIPSDDVSYYLTQGASVYFNQKLITEQGKVYFRVYGLEGSPDYDSYDKNESVAFSGFLPSEILDTYPSYARLYISNYKGDEPKDLLETIGNSLNGAADLEKVYISGHDFGKKRLFEVEVKRKTYYLETDNAQPIKILFLKDGGNYLTVYKGIGSVEFNDLDGDGIPEILATENEGRSGDVNQTLYRFNGSKFETIESYSANYDSGCGRISLYGSEISRNDDRCSKEQKALYSPFRFKLKKGKLVPAE